MRLAGFITDCGRKWIKGRSLETLNHIRFSSFLELNSGRVIERFICHSYHSSVQTATTDNDKNPSKATLANDLAFLVEEASTIGNRKLSKENEKDTGQTSLAKDLAFLVEEASVLGDRNPRTRVEQKKFLQLRIKKRVKEQYVNGKFHDLLTTVIANPVTLQDAYDCIKVDSNVDLASERDCLSFESLAEELACGNFDVSSNVFNISTKGAEKEVLVLPNLKLKVVQEAIRIVLEVIYKPHFSKISHGCRSGRGHLSALKYICKEVSKPDWWFTLPINKKLDAHILSKLTSTMEAMIEDPSLYAIIQSMFDSQVLNLEFGGFAKGHGLVQEGVLSPILMNIYLDLFDSEVYRMSMRYEAFNKGFQNEQTGLKSNLRNWLRRQIKGNTIDDIGGDNFGTRVHCCRFMDEIFFAVSGSKDVALAFKSEIQSYLQDTLHLDVDNQVEILPSNDPEGIRFLGTLVRRTVHESPAVRTVHKLKEKVKIFASQKKESWDDGSVKIGKKWLAHGLKKVKESEIKHLADSDSLLSQISGFRKSGMETDHWYKVLLKVWMQDMNATTAESEEIILSKFIAEPALPQDLKDAFYEFQKQADNYVSAETASLVALLPNSRSSGESVTTTEIIAPINNIKKRLFRYGLTNAKGFPCTLHKLILQDSSQIVDWFAGLVSRWLRWYSRCQNFTEIKLLICDQVRMSCIRTLASKYRVHESEIEKKFDSELSRIPSTPELELDVTSDSQASHYDNTFLYGVSYSGLCLLSLARIVSQARPCNCFAIGCSAAAPCVYTLEVMERQRFPGWKTGFSTCIHPSLNKRRIGLCKQHLRDLYLGHISLQAIDFGAWK